ncbi:unnamed protein product [Vicia faba]|uniref:RRM domain-containing protein n=1 Tax=Vicia faba TaxID=3906 RepID=A0AAV1B9R2_VICFA|nr:unnamed protein product [Vicia faba]
MALTMRAAAAAPRGLRRFFCSNPIPSSPTFPFASNPSSGATSARQMADPNTNLFVSGLSKRTTTERLREEFQKFGEVVHARVVTDRVSGYSKGFGFVQYATLEDAAKGIEGDGWQEYARPRPPPGEAVNNMTKQYGRPY